MGKLINDVIDPDIKFSLVEDNSEVDGEHILAKVKGQFFVPDGKSRNGRFYPRSLWEKVIADKAVKAKLEKRTMFGTLGHDAALTDKEVREGLVSHFMTDISIDKNGKGMGEALILNTPVGKILNTMLRAGSQLSVSSRANGTFKGKKNGLPVVDENTYGLEGWDFIIEPGFLEANPEIAESLENINIIEGEEIMENDINKTLVEHIANENADLKSKVGGLTDEVNTLAEEKTVIKEENDHLKDENAKLVDTNKVLESYSTLGTVEEITEKLTKADENGKILEAYNELSDSPEDNKAALEKSRDFIKTVTEEFGTIDEVRKALETAIEFKEKVEDIGGYEKIKEALESYDKELTERSEVENTKKIKDLAEELGLTEEKVTELLGKYSEEDVKELCKVTESAKNPYKKENFNEDKTDENEDEEVYESRILGSSRIDRLNERMGK